MSSPRYSQPLSENPGRPSPPILRVGFVGRGADRRPGYIFSGADGKEKRVAAGRDNMANEQPRGFFQSLARIFAGGPAK